MSLRRNCLPLLLTLVASISIVEGADKDKNKFSPGPASSFASKQTDNGVTIAAVAYDTEALASTAFGKMNPYSRGVLPVLVVIQNDSKQSVKLERMDVQYIAADREKIEPTSPRDVPLLRAPKRPNMNGTPLPGLGGRNKNPLGGPEIEGRAFAAKMLPPGESAHGFFYFQTGHRGGAKLYMKGLEEAATGKELFYFEIPLDTH
jgi:hypothetical protein